MNTHHRCLIYEGAPSQHLPLITSKIREQLQANMRCMVLNSPPMIAGVRAYLAAREIDMEAEIKKGALILSSDQSHLVDGFFDTNRMIDLLTDAVDLALRDGYSGLFASGDMTWEFGQEKNLAKLMEYEWELEKMFQRTPAFKGICQYHKETLPLQILGDALRTHPSVYLNDTLHRVNPFFFPPHIIADVHLFSRRHPCDVPQMLKHLAGD